jgi:hypothetical protein
MPVRRIEVPQGILDHAEKLSPNKSPECLMRKATATAVFPVGWPPLSETLAKVVAKQIPIFS